jgi:hypothetical protein
MGEALDQPGPDDAQAPPQYGVQAPSAPTPDQPLARTKGRKYSFLDAQSRHDHPIVTALVANAIAGKNAFHLIDALDQRDLQRQQSFAAAGMKRYEYGRQLAMKMGDAGAMEPDDPLRPQFERAFEAIKSSEPPEGYTWDPRTRKMYKIPTEPSANIAAEGGIYEVTGKPGQKSARPIPIQEPGAPTATAGPPAVPTAAQGGVAPSPTTPPSRTLQPRPPKPAVQKAEPTELKQDKTGRWVPVSKITGLTPTGETVQGPGPASLMGIQTQISNAILGLQRMKEARQRSAGQSLTTKTTGAFAAGLGRMVPPLRGATQSMTTSGSDATQHETNRSLVSAMLVRPLFGTSRAVGLADMVEQAVPHFTDTGPVADNFYDQMGQFLKNARRLPWDQDPSGAQEYYGQMLDGFLAGRLGEQQQGAAGGGGTSDMDLAQLRKEYATGRMTPQRKEQLRQALRERGHLK